MSFSPFEYVNVPSTKKTYFPLNNEVKFDCDAGQIIPFFSRIVLPSDYWKIRNEIVVRTLPQNFATMHTINVETAYFYVPLRILFGHDVVDDDGNVVDYEVDDNAFLHFLTGGKDGRDDSVSLPRWTPTGASIVNDNWNGLDAGEEGSNIGFANVTTTDNGVYSLWDYFGFPIGVRPTGATPTDFARRAYNLIYNRYWRDQNLQDMVSITNSKVMNCCWKKDYFTSALPWQQRGPAYQLPVTGNIPISVVGQGFSPLVYRTSPSSGVSDLFLSGIYKGSENNSLKNGFFVTGKSDNSTYVRPFDFASTDSQISLGSDDTGSFFPLGVNVGNLSGTANASYATTFNVNDLRIAFQIQKFFERQALSGVATINQFLIANYGVAPKNETIQNPVYLGGSKQPVIISEVLQTSRTDTTDEAYLGDIGGHGLSASQNYIASYYAKEFGIILGLMVIRPKADYMQGISKEFLWRSRFDLFNPLFTNLGEDIVEDAQIFATDSDNVDANGEPKIFGYQGRYNEYRSSVNEIHGGLRSTYDYYHLAREFDSKPSLNSDFVKCNPSKRIFVSNSEPAYIVAIANNVDAYRPLPLVAQPGFIDHH